MNVMYNYSISSSSYLTLFPVLQIHFMCAVPNSSHLFSFLSYVFFLETFHPSEHIKFEAMLDEDIF